MTYKQVTDVNQALNLVEVVPETYVPNGNDNTYQDLTIYQNVDPQINQDIPTYISNTMTQWNYQMNAAQTQPPTAEEELQRKISTVSTVSNLSSLSSDSVQGLVLQDIQHHAVIHEENALQNNQNIYVHNQEAINVNPSENVNNCNIQLTPNDVYLSNVQSYQENQVCLNYTNNNQVNLPEEINIIEEKPVDTIEPINISTESDVKQNLR